jgi:TRAP-type C4-dicarboxylate transport system substrate-binding protein
VILLNRFGEVQNYVTITKHIYNPLQLLMSKKTWDKMSADERNIIQDAANESKMYQRKFAREQDANAAEALTKAGVQVSEVPPQELARMREKAKPVIDKYSKEVSDALVKEVNAGIAQVCAGK